MSPDPSGWLASTSIAVETRRRKFGGAFALSLVLHGLGALALLALVTADRASVSPTPLPRPENVVPAVFLDGGGGGHRSVLTGPPEPVEIRPAPPAPTPLAPTPVPVETPPPPSLDLNVAAITNPLVRTTGVLIGPPTPRGGGGAGTGLGPGRGPGLNDGERGNTGGGPRQIGNGVTSPVLIAQVDPQYTSEAMRRKIQGEVHLQAVIRADGSVGELRVIRSLDARAGLDLEAMRVARLWRFQPATYMGKPVDVYATLVLEFRLH